MLLKFSRFLPSLACLGMQIARLDVERATESIRAGAHVFFVHAFERGQAPPKTPDQKDQASKQFQSSGKVEFWHGVG